MKLAALLRGGSATGETWKATGYARDTAANAVPYLRAPDEQYGSGFVCTFIGGTNSAYIYGAAYTNQQYRQLYDYDSDNADNSYRIYRYTMPSTTGDLTGIDINTYQYIEGPAFGTLGYYISKVVDMTFSNDGYNLYLLVKAKDNFSLSTGPSPYYVLHITLGTAWDLLTASFTSSKQLPWGLDASYPDYPTGYIGVAFNDSNSAGEGGYTLYLTAGEYSLDAGNTYRRLGVIGYDMGTEYVTSTLDTSSFTEYANTAGFVYSRSDYPHKREQYAGLAIHGQWWYIKRLPLYLTTGDGYPSPPSRWENFGTYAIYKSSDGTSSTLSSPVSNYQTAPSWQFYAYIGRDLSPGEFPALAVPYRSGALGYSSNPPDNIVVSHAANTYLTNMSLSTSYNLYSTPTPVRRYLPSLLTNTSAWQAVSFVSEPVDSTLTAPELDRDSDTPYVCPTAIKDHIWSADGTILYVIEGGVKYYTSTQPSGRPSNSLEGFLGYQKFTASIPFDPTSLSPAEINSSGAFPRGKVTAGASGLSQYGGPVGPSTYCGGCFKPDGTVFYLAFRPSGLFRATISSGIPYAYNAGDGDYYTDSLGSGANWLLAQNQDILLLVLPLNTPWDIGSYDWDASYERALGNTGLTIKVECFSTVDKYGFVGMNGDYEENTRATESGTLAFSPDGTKINIGFDSGDFDADQRYHSAYYSTSTVIKANGVWRCYTLGTAWDVTTIAPNPTELASTSATFAYGTGSPGGKSIGNGSKFAFDPSGNYVFRLSRNLLKYSGLNAVASLDMSSGLVLEKYALDTPWDITSVNTATGVIESCRINPVSTYVKPYAAVYGDGGAIGAAVDGSPAASLIAYSRGGPLYTNAETDSDLVSDEVATRNLSYSFSFKPNGKVITVSMIEPTMGWWPAINGAANTEPFGPTYRAITQVILNDD